MGYFRILYYISYIINTISRLIRRHGKFLLWFIGIFVFLFFTMYTTRSHAAFEGDYDYADPNYAFNQMYNDVCIRFLKRYIQSPDSTLKTSISNYVKDRNYKHYIYFSGGYTTDGSSMMNQFNYDDSFYYIIFIPSYGGSWTRVLNSDTYMSIPNISCSTYTFTDPNLGDAYRWKLFRVKTNTIEEISISDGFKVYMPSNCFGMINTYIYDFFFNDFSLEEIELLREMENKVDSIDNTITQTHEYITSEPSEEDFSDEDLPSDSGVTDTTEEYTNTIFTSFYNALTREPSSLDIIEIYVPFTNKMFRIPYSYTSTFVPNALKTIISMFWYFAFSILIYKDVMHKFNKIRSGDIEHVQDNNIKEDIL